ncbi:hypothetical protein TKK_0017703 [Trichogramma kaykai]
MPPQDVFCALLSRPASSYAGTGNSPSSSSLVHHIVAALFPLVRDKPALPLVFQAGAIVPAITLKKLRRAYKRIKEHIAPGSYGVPNSAIKIAIATNPDIILPVYTADQFFPAHWKRQRLVLLSKPGKSPEESSSHRPLCMLDTAGKILGRIICDRLKGITESPGASQTTSTTFGRNDRRLTPLRTFSLPLDRLSLARDRTAAPRRTAPS